MRIGAMVSDGTRLCEGVCGPQHQGQPPHYQPNWRFTLLLLVTVIEKPLPGMADDSPLIGGPFTPPTEVVALQAAPSKAAEQFVRLIGWN